MDTKLFEISGKRIRVAGHRGMVGGAVVRPLANENCEIPTIAHGELDLTRQADVERWPDRQRTDAINLKIGSNAVSATHKAGVRRLVNLGSSCRLLDDSRLATLGWRASTDLADGLGQMYQWCCNSKVNAAA